METAPKRMSFPNNHVHVNIMFVMYLYNNMLPEKGPFGGIDGCVNDYYNIVYFIVTHDAKLTFYKCTV